MLLKKRRTREHVIAEMGAHHVEGLALEQGWTAERVWHDYGYDLNIFTFDTEGYVEPGSLLVQIKSTESLANHSNEEYLIWDMDVRDLRLWREEVMPVLFVVYDVLAKIAYWLYIQEEFASADLENRLYLRCRIPRNNFLTTDTLAGFGIEKQSRMRSIRRT